MNKGSRDFLFTAKMINNGVRVCEEEIKNKAFEKVGVSEGSMKQFFSSMVPVRETRIILSLRFIVFQLVAASSHVAQSENKLTVKERNDIQVI